MCDSWACHWEWRQAREGPCASAEPFTSYPIDDDTQPDAGNESSNNHYHHHTADEHRSWCNDADAGLTATITVLYTNAWNHNPGKIFFLIWGLFLASSVVKVDRVCVFLWLTDVSAGLMDTWRLNYTCEVNLHIEDDDQIAARIICCL